MEKSTDRERLTGSQTLTESQLVLRRVFWKQTIVPTATNGISCGTPARTTTQQCSTARGTLGDYTVAGKEQCPVCDGETHPNPRHQCYLGLVVFKHILRHLRARVPHKTIQQNIASAGRITIAIKEISVKIAVTYDITPLKYTAYSDPIPEGRPTPKSPARSIGR